MAGFGEWLFCLYYWYRSRSIANTSNGYFTALYIYFIDIDILFYYHNNHNLTVIGQNIPCLFSRRSRLDLVYNKNTSILFSFRFWILHVYLESRS